MATQKELLSVYNQMENERQQLLQELSKYPAETLEKKPDANSWSVTEVIYHLIIAERGALSYLNKKLEVGGFGKATFQAGLKQKLLNFAISLPVKYKAPKVVQLPKDASVTYEEAVSQWDEIRANMKKAYEGLDDDFTGRELFKHPFAGKMNIVQGLKFMRQHMNRHIGQIERTLKQVA